MNAQLDSTLAAALSYANPVEQAGTIIDYLQEYGDTFYDASVTQLEHSLQNAFLARKEQAAGYLVVAELLHDIGHLLVDEHAANTQFLQNDLSHETVGCKRPRARPSRPRMPTDPSPRSGQTLSVHHRPGLLRLPVRFVQPKFPSSGWRNVSRPTGLF